MRRSLTRAAAAIATALLAAGLVTAVAVPANAATSTLPTMTHISSTSGSTTAWHRLTVTGTHLDNVTRIYILGVRASRLVHPKSHKTTQLSFSLPPAPQLVAASSRVRFVVKGGSAHHVAAVSYNWKVLSAVDREMDYVFHHWQDTSSDVYDYFPGDDCANFASQALVARGWVQSDAWHDSIGFNYSYSFIRSTALRDYLKTTHAVALTDKQRSRVRIGDIVQLDYDHSGDRDHTGIVSKIVHQSNGHYSIYFAGHTRDEKYRSLDYVITDKHQHPGSAVYYWHPGQQ